MLAQRTVATVARRAAIAPTVSRGLSTTIIRCNSKPAQPSKPGKPAQSSKAQTPLTPSTPKEQAQALSGNPDAKIKPYKTLKDISKMDDLIGPGSEPGTIPTDLEQAAGLERLELLAKMEGVDIFDMRPLDASRIGTMEDPIMVNSAGEEQYLGCSGSPADSHSVRWLTLSTDRPVERCPECGSVYKMEYIGPPIETLHAAHVEYPEPKTFADHVKPDYRYR